jgi:hypothetical protein
VKRSPSHALACILFVSGLLGPLAAEAVPVAWVGDSSGNWSDPARWDVGLPAAGDDVTIDRGAASPTVTHGAFATELGSLVNRESLVVAGGQLTTSSLSGSATSNFTVSGAGGLLVATGPTQIDGSSLSAQSGGRIELPSLTHYSTGASTRTFFANGAGSEIDLSGVATLSGATGALQTLNLYAFFGGRLDSSGVSSLADASYVMWANGADAVVDVSNVDAFVDPRGASRLHASRGGTVQLGLAGPIAIDGFWLIRDGATSSLDTSAVTSLQNSIVEVRGGGVSLALAQLSTLDGNSFSANEGARLAVSASAYAAGTRQQILSASGPGSALDFASITALAGPSTPLQELQIDARAGGQIDLSGVSAFADANYVVRATGANSVVDLSNVAAFVDSDGASVLEAGSGGTLRLGGAQPVSIDRFRLILDGASSTLDTSSVAVLRNSVVDARGVGASFAFAQVASLDESSFLASAGAQLTLGRGSYAMGVDRRQIAASGTSGGIASRIDGSAIATLTGGVGTGRELDVRASGGGVVDLSGLRTIAGGVAIDASGAGSVVDLASLERFAATGTLAAIGASAGGRVQLGVGAPTVLEGVLLNASETGTVSAAALHALAGSSVRGEGALDIGALLIDDSGVLDPGLSTLGGRIELLGDFTHGPTGVLRIDLAGVQATSYDRVLVAGNAVLSGTIQVNLSIPVGTTTPFAPRVGDLFDVLMAESISDAGFVIGGSPGADRAWFAQILHAPGGDTLRLSVVAIPEPSLSSLGLLGLSALARARAGRNSPPRG